ncbi:MAG: hypothetical protein H6672_12330 [Anaerolineaceae bacterium]|nr:hypothetical protein [Anaerolineaceae bacterium]
MDKHDQARYSLACTQPWSSTMRPLNPWNPLDPFRLLGWVFLHPEFIRDYPETYDKKSMQRTGSWLVSTLTWIPIMIPVLGYGLATIPVGASRSGLFLAGFYGILWLLTGIFGTRTSEPVGFAVGISLFFFMLSISFAVTAGATPGILVSVALVISGLIVRAIAVLVAGHLAAHVSGGVILGITAGTAAVSFGGVLAGFIIAVAVPAGLLITYTLSYLVAQHLQGTFKEGRPSLQGKILLALIPLGAVAALWVFFLGGWQLIVAG